MRDEEVETEAALSRRLVVKGRTDIKRCWIEGETFKDVKRSEHIYMAKQRTMRQREVADRLNVRKSSGNGHAREQTVKGANCQRCYRTPSLGQPS